MGKFVCGNSWEIINNISTIINHQKLDRKFKEIMSDDSDPSVKIMQLIKRRKNYLNIIEHSLSNGDAFFAKCFRLSENIEETLHRDPA